MSSSSCKSVHVALDPVRREIRLQLDWEDDTSKDSSKDGKDIVARKDSNKKEDDAKVMSGISSPLLSDIGRKKEREYMVVVGTNFRAPNNAVSVSAVDVMTPGTTASRTSGGTAEILPQERAKATFEVERLTNILDGGPERTARRRFIISPTEKSDVSDKYSWDRSVLLREHLHQFMETHSEFWNKISPSRDDIRWMVDNSMLGGAMSVPYSLIVPTLKGQGSEEQAKWWIPKVVSCQMVCVYGQTELGHGSNVRGIRTTATYDKLTREFVIHTPCLTATKAWISGGGKVATHALVYAQLILEGKEYGVHVFMVQLRDENHRPLPGVEIGDLGTKLGDNTNDTAFIRFNQLRIPREHMLCRWETVTPEGEYVKSTREKSDPKVRYATMLLARASMIRSAAGVLARATTVAVRYSCVRHQGFVDTSTKSHLSEENAVIDYQMQRYRLFKQLSLTYALKFVGMWMGDQLSNLEGLTNVSFLPELAGTSMGLKGLITFMVSQGVEDCRKCLGGHGYLLSSGVAWVGADYVFQVTAEGDYVVMMLQTARFLIKSLRNARQGKILPGPVGYLSVLSDRSFDASSVQAPKASSPKDFKDVGFLLKLHQAKALMEILNVGAELEAKLSSGWTFDKAWNSCAVELVRAVRAHCLTLILDLFSQSISTVKDAACLEVLQQLCAVFGCANILEENWCGLLDWKQEKLARAAVSELLDALRPNAVALVDAFDIPDRVLCSPLGRADGNVYESLFEFALKSPLNRTDPFDGYEQYLKPYLNREFLKHGNKLNPESKL